jgi:hypothetical protein
MSAIGNIPDIRNSIAENARQQRRAESAAISKGGQKSGREVVNAGIYKLEAMRNALHSAMKDKALSNIRGEDETRVEQEAKAKQAKLSIMRERRHDAIREKFIEEEGKGGALRITV